jgi:Holliday junction resolvase-like predicted endonuclease
MDDGAAFISPSKSSKILDACGHFLLSQAKIMPEALPLQFDCKSAAN